MTVENNKPQPPEEWECCESGCSPCVWDNYYDELRQWENKQTATSAAAE